jgi:hypothetical protein
VPQKGIKAKIASKFYWRIGRNTYYCPRKKYAKNNFSSAVFPELHPEESRTQLGVI